MDNKRSHDIVDKSLEMLRRLDHRGGVGADGITGDGAGIMTEIPFDYFNKHVDFELPCEGEYAVGLFFSQKVIVNTRYQKMIDLLFRSEGLKVLGYREVPVNKEVLAQHVAKTMPYVYQIFVDITNHQDIEKSYIWQENKLNTKLNNRG